MADFGNIDLEAAPLREMAVDIDRQESLLTGYFVRLEERMTQLERDGMNSEAGRELKSKFANLKMDYERKYPPAFKEYRTFLDEAANHYEDKERARKDKVASLEQTF